MISVLSIPFALILAYFLNSLYAFTRNLIAARASGLPYVCIPYDQDGFIWMVVSVPLRPHLQRLLPQWIWDRMSVTIYGFEFHEGLQLFSRFASSPTAAPQRSFILVSPGKFEISTMDTEVAEQVLRRPRDFVPHDFTELFMGRFGPNVLTSEGEAWARQRKVIAGSINERISRTVFSESIKHTQGLLAEVLNGKDHDGAKSGETTQLFDMMKKITINVLSGAGMGASIEWEDRETPKPGYKFTYIEGVKRVIDAVAGPIVLPSWFLSNYPTFLPGHKMIRELNHAINEFPKHTVDLLEKERERSSGMGAGTRGNIMSQLLQASEGEKGSKALSEDEMLGNLFIFTAAGFDTTANTLSYALANLTRYPKWQKWVHEEIDSIMPEDANVELEYTTIFPKAIRVMAVMLETLRLFAPLVHIPKMTRTPQIIQTSTETYRIPERSTVYLNAVALHTVPDVWRNINLGDGEKESETDEYDFRPTRWINHASGGTQLFQPPKGSFIPWSAGPRVCPGQKMAQVEFVSIFLTLFRHHRLEAVPLSLGLDGRMESREQVEERLERRIRDSISILTLQMVDVYDKSNGELNGLNMRLIEREKDKLLD